MSSVSSACLTHVLDHLNLNTIESLRDMTKLRVVGFVGSAQCGKSRMARSLVGSRTWGAGSSSRSQGGLGGRSRTTPQDLLLTQSRSGVGAGYSAAQSQAEPAPSAALPKTLSPAEALDCSPLVPLSTVAAINGVSMNHSAAALAMPLRKPGGEEEDEFEAQMAQLGAASSSSSLESQVLVVDCAIPWGCDGLERSVASFIPVFVTPASVVVWHAKTTSSSLEDTIMGLYSCCSVARQICACRGSGTPSIYERPPNLILVVREFPTSSPDSSSPGPHEGSTTADSLSALLCTSVQQQQPQKAVLVQRRYPNLVPLCAVVRDFFKDSISVSSVPDISQGAHMGLPSSVSGASPLLSGGSGVVLQKEERDAVAQLITMVAATAYTAPSVDDIRRQFSVLRAPSANSGSPLMGSSSSSAHAESGASTHWSWLSVLESVYLNQNSGGGNIASVVNSRSGAASPSVLQRRDQELATKKEAFLVEEALDALLSLLQQQHGGAGVVSLEEGKHVAHLVEKSFNLAAHSNDVARRYNDVAENLITQHIETAAARRQQVARVKIESRMSSLVSQCQEEVDRLSKIVSLTQRDESEVLLWEEEVPMLL